MRNIKLTLEYLGTRYAGFQKQPNLPTIQGELEKVLQILLKEEVRITAAGRTDAGVHASCQVINFKTASTLDLRRLKWSANALLPPDIVIKRAEEVDLSFNARRNATFREYRYCILNRNHPSVFQRDLAHFISSPLNLAVLQRAAALLQGRHNFSAFCQADGREVNDYVRTVSDLSCGQKGDLIIIKIRADSFLPHMVRIVVGTLIQVGLGKLRPDEVGEILKSRDRTRAGPTAPAKGLILTGIEYPAGG